MKLYTSFYFAHWRYAWKDGDLLKGQLVLPVAAMRVTERVLEFKVGSGETTSVTLQPEAVASEKFDVLDGDVVEGALVDVNKWGRSLPRTFSFVVEFPGVAPEQPGPVTLELSDE